MDCQTVFKHGILKPRTCQRLKVKSQVKVDKSNNPIRVTARITCENATAASSELKYTAVARLIRSCMYEL